METLAAGVPVGVENVAIPNDWSQVLLCPRDIVGEDDEEFGLRQFLHASEGSGVIVEVWHSAFSGADILLDRLSYWSATSAMPDGDIDNNGTVDMADGLLLLRCALGISSVNETIMLHGDLDGDGVITVNDSLILVRIVLGIIN